MTEKTKCERNIGGNRE